MDGTNQPSLSGPASSSSPFISFLKRHHLAILLLSVLLKQAVLVFVVPPWQVPDEPAHFQYVQTLVEQKVWPTYARPTVYSREVVDSYNAMSKKYEGRIPIYNRTISYSTTPDVSQRWAATGTPNNIAALYGPPYYVYEAIPYSIFYQADIDTRLYAMRIWSSLLFVALVCVAYWVGRIVRPGIGFAATLAILVGFQPMLSYISVGVNNDALLNLLGGMAFALLIVKLPATRRTALMVALLSGLAMMTKQSGWIFIPAVGLYIWWIAGQEKKTSAERWRLTALTAGVGGIVGVSWSLLSYLAGGGDFLNGEGTTNLTTTVDPTVGNVLMVDLLERSVLVWQRFWGSYGWSGTVIEHPNEFYNVMAIMMVASLAGLVVGRFLWPRAVERSALRRALWAGFGLFFILDLFFRVLYWQRALQYHYYAFPAQGRYYFLLIIPFFLFMLYGFDRYVQDPWKKWVWAVVGAGMIVLSVLSASLLAHWYDISRPV